jgi:hypothetical protein
MLSFKRVAYMKHAIFENNANFELTGIDAELKGCSKRLFQASRKAGRCHRLGWRFSSART